MWVPLRSLLTASLTALPAKKHSLLQHSAMRYLRFQLECICSSRSIPKQQNLSCHEQKTDKKQSLTSDYHSAQLSNCNGVVAASSRVSSSDVALAISGAK